MFHAYQHYTNRSFGKLLCSSPNMAICKSIADAEADGYRDELLGIFNSDDRLVAYRNTVQGDVKEWTEPTKELADMIDSNFFKGRGK